MKFKHILLGIFLLLFIGFGVLTTLNWPKSISHQGYSLSYPTSYAVIEENNWLDFYSSPQAIEELNSCQASGLEDLNLPCGYGTFMATVFIKPGNSSLANNPEIIPKVFKDFSGREWQLYYGLPWVGSPLNLNGPDAVADLGQGPVTVTILFPHYVSDSDYELFQKLVLGSIQLN